MRHNHFGPPGDPDDNNQGPSHGAPYTIAHQTLDAEDVSVGDAPSPPTYTLSPAGVVTWQQPGIYGPPDTQVTSQEMAAIIQAVPSPAPTPTVSQTEVSPSLNLAINVALANAHSPFNVTATTQGTFEAPRIAIPSETASIPSFSRARTPTVSISSSSSPMDASPSAGNFTFPTRPGGDSPDKPTVITSSMDTDPYTSRPVMGMGALPPRTDVGTLPLSTGPAGTSHSTQVPEREEEARALASQFDRVSVPPPPSLISVLGHSQDTMRELDKAYMHEGPLLTGEEDLTLLAPDDVVRKATELMYAAQDELNQAVEGYSHYFLDEPLRFLHGNRIDVESDALKRMLSVISGVVSMGPRTEDDYANGDSFVSLTNNSWYRVVLFLIASVLRGCARTADVAARGEWPIEPDQDTFLYARNLQKPSTQLMALHRMLEQLYAAMHSKNGHRMPHAKAEEVKDRIWSAHERAIVAEIEKEAATIQHRISTMHLSDIVDQIATETPIQEITETIRDGVQMEVRSKYKNSLLALQQRTYESLRAKAIADGEAQATAESARMVKVDEGIRAHNAYELGERRKELSLQLKHMTEIEEREFITTHAVRLGIVSRDSAAASNPALKRARTGPKSMTAAQAVARTRSRSVSVSSTRKRGRSTSPPAIAEPRSETPHNDPASGNYTAADDITPTASPSRANPPAQMVSQVDLFEDAPTRSVASSSHNPANQMEMVPPSPPSQPIFISCLGGDQAEVDGAIPSDTSQGSTPEPEPTHPLLAEIARLFNVHFKPFEQELRRVSRLVDENIKPSWIKGKTTPLAPAPPPPPPNSTPPIPVPEGSQGRVGDPTSAESTTTQRERLSGTLPPAHLDDNDFPALTPQTAGKSRNARQRAKQRALREAHNDSVPGTGPTTHPAPTSSDDGHIPIRKSRIAPTFANVTTAKAIQQQQSAAGFISVARKAQHRGPTGNRKAGFTPSASDTTDITVIRNGGDEDEKRERGLRARDPVAFVQAAQRALDRASKAAPRILKGRWSRTVDNTGNFVYTLAGTIPPENIGALRDALCEPFPGATTIVPVSGWTWAQLRNVPTHDADGTLYNNDDLLRAFVANPCFANVYMPVPPTWQGNPANFRQYTSTVSVAYTEEDKTVTQRAALEGVCMFGAQVHFVHCGDSPALVQCGRCHELGHHANSKVCKVARDKARCFRCGGPHEHKDHDYECNASHKVLGKCDCPLKCLLCKQTGHHARSRLCTYRGDFAAPRLVTPRREEEDTEGETRNPPEEQHQGRKQKQTRFNTPITQSLIKEANTIPLQACVNDPSKNVLQCTCCKPPALGEALEAQIMNLKAQVAAFEAEHGKPTTSRPKARPAYRGARETTSAQVNDEALSEEDEQRIEDFLNSTDIPDMPQDTFDAIAHNAHSSAGILGWGPSVPNAIPAEIPLPFPAGGGAISGSSSQGVTAPNFNA